MSRRNQERVAMLNRLNEFCNVRRAMKDLHLSAREFADQALALRARFVRVLGGPARFTGNNRVFANGTIASEVRCRQCHETFWITGMPYALCPDCDLDSR